MLKLRTVGVIFALVGAMALAACGDDDNGSSDSGSSGGGGGGESGSIALLLPESKTARYESQDRPNFEKQGEGALRGLRDHLLERGPGRGQAAAAG